MSNCKTRKKSKQNTCHQRTIDGDGDSLGELEAVGTLEGRDLAEGLDLAVLGARVLGAARLSLDQVQLKAVVLGSDQGGDGTTVVLRGVRRDRRCSKKKNIQGDRRAFRKPF